MNETNEEKARDRVLKKLAKRGELIEFFGETLPRGEIQESLDHMSAPERMMTLTQDRVNQVTQGLEKYVEAYQEMKEELGPLFELNVDEEETLKNGAALFNEWKELLDEDTEGCGSQYDGDGVADWTSSQWLKSLYRKKKMTQWWKDH